MKRRADSMKMGTQIFAEHADCAEATDYADFYPRLSAQSASSAFYFSEQATRPADTDNDEKRTQIAQKPQITQIFIRAYQPNPRRPRSIFQNSNENRHAETTETTELRRFFIRADQPHPRRPRSILQGSEPLRPQPELSKSCRRRRGAARPSRCVRRVRAAR